MKQVLIFLFSLLTTAWSTFAQNDTMYIMKSGVVVEKFNVHTQIDSIIFYSPQNLSVNAFTDTRDGNVYHSVTIGTQVWMAENLKYIPSVNEPTDQSQSLPRYYVFGYSGTNLSEAISAINYQTYGVLYNWPAAMNGQNSSSSNPSAVQGACPLGWHLPSDAEWTQLTDYLEGESVAGGKLKEIGNLHWSVPNNGATNSVNFSALPGGNLNSSSSFGYSGTGGYWWCATELDAYDAWFRGVYNHNTIVGLGDVGKELGFSIRCVED